MNRNFTRGLRTSQRALAAASMAIVIASGAPANAATTARSNSTSAAKADARSSSSGDRLQAAWAKVVGYASGFLEEPQQKQLYDIAYAAAVPGVCSDFAVDRKAVEQGFEQFDTPAFRKLSLEDQRKFEQRLLATYGVAVGMLLADGSLHEREFCAYAEEQRTAPVSRYWLPKGSTADASTGPAVGSPRPSVPATALPPTQSPRVLSVPAAPSATR
ncbi:MAG: hypothetical protein ACKO2K_15930 [Alphaproteobacteria bacterium]